MQKNIRMQFESGFKHLIFKIFEKSLLELSTPIKRSIISIPYLNTSQSRFRYLKTVTFIKRKIISTVIPYHVLGRLMADLINQENPQNKLI